MAASAATAPKKTSSIGAACVTLVVVFLTFMMYVHQNGSPLGGIGLFPPTSPGFGVQSPSDPNAGTGGSGVVTNSPTPSATSTPDNTRSLAINEAVNSDRGRQLVDKGYIYQDVLEPASDNGQYSKWLDGITARTGTYVLFRNYEKRVDAANPAIAPDMVMLVGTGTGRDYQIVGYFQSFSNERSLLCVQKDSDTNLNDRNVWSQIADATHQKSMGEILSFNKDDISAVGSDTIECGFYRPEDELLPAS